MLRARKRQRVRQRKRIRFVKEVCPIIMVIIALLTFSMSRIDIIYEDYAELSFRAMEEPVSDSIAQTSSNLWVQVPTPEDHAGLRTFSEINRLTYKLMPIGLNNNIIELLFSTVDTSIGDTIYLARGHTLITFVVTNSHFDGIRFDWFKVTWKDRLRGTDLFESESEVITTLFDTGSVLGILISDLFQYDELRLCNNDKRNLPPDIRTNYRSIRAKVTLFSHGREYPAIIDVKMAKHGPEVLIYRESWFTQLFDNMLVAR